MGTHGGGALRHMLLGGTVDKILGSECPGDGGPPSEPPAALAAPLETMVGRDASPAARGGNGFSARGAGDQRNAAQPRRGEAID